MLVAEGVLILEKFKLYLRTEKENNSDLDLINEKVNGGASSH